MKLLITTLLIVLCFYLLYCGAFYVFQRKFIFPINQLPASDTELIYRTGGDIIRLPFSQGEFEVAYLPSLNSSGKPAPVIFLAHGNGNIMDSWADNMGFMRNRGYAVVLLEYPGYGRSNGSPSYDSIKEATAIAYQWIGQQAELDNKNITLVGRSMGGGAVLSLFDGTINQDNQPRRLVLMSTYSSLADIIAKKGLPSVLLKDPFDNVTQLAKFNGKSYLIHGDRDQVVPIDSLAKLLAVAQDAEHRIYAAGHNDIPDNWSEFWQQVADFIEQ